MTIDFTMPEITSFIGDVVNTVPNAVLTFNVLKAIDNSTIEFLPDGNPYLLPPEYITVSLSCYLKEVSFSSAILEAVPGADTQTNYFEGRLIIPKKYPMPIQAQGPITAMVNGQLGRVVSHRAFSSPLARTLGYDAVLGQKIALFVQFQQGIAS